MRSFFAALIVLTTVGGFASQADAASLKGSWAGSGYFEFDSGKRERVRCRVSYSPQTPKVVAVSANCASASGKVNQTGSLSSAGNGRYIGDFYNAQFDIGGRIRVVVKGAIQTITFNASNGGSGRVTLSQR